MDVIFFRIFWPIWTCIWLAFGLWLIASHAATWTWCVTLGFTVPLSAFSAWNSYRE